MAPLAFRSLPLPSGLLRLLRGLGMWGEFMKVAAVILCVFAAVWGVFGLSFAGMQMPWLTVPPVISLALLAWVLPQLRAAGWVNPPETRRVVARWSSIEVPAMVLAIVLLKRTGHVDAIAPVMTLIVGAHMFPIARALKARFQYFTGIALVAVGLAALAFEGDERAVAAGLASAAILWAAVIWLGYQARTGGKP